ncbi:MAG: TetR/AcrR family transcriptional regulator [Actinomycetota bacterium]
MAERGAQPAAGQRRSQRGEETRARVLDAASRLFALHGFDSTSVEAVADAAGITVPGMYKHFRTKRELLLAVARRTTRTSAARQALGEEGDLADQLAELFAEYLADGQIERRRLSIEMSRAAFGDDDLRAALASYNELLRDALAETIRRARPAMDEVEAGRLSHLLLILLMGAIHLDTLDADRIGDDALVRHLRSRFQRLLDDSGGQSQRRPGRLPVTVLEPVPEPEPSDGRRARTVRTRRRILQAAHELFALHGYDGATIDAIATRAEITVPGLYRHVPSKEVLLLEVAERAFGRYRVLSPLDTGRPATVQLAELLAAFSLAGDEVDRRIAVELDFGAWRSEALADALQQFHRRMRQNVVAALTFDLAEQQDIELCALVFLMLFMGVAHLDTVDPSLVGDPSWADLLRRRVPQLIS